MAGRARLVNAAAVFVSPDLRRTSEYYRDIFGFEIVEHHGTEDAFAALYRDEVEIIVVQSQRGEFESNTARYGAGYDLYLDPEDLEGVDALYSELKEKGARIVREPAITPYGCYEFVVEDIDGRLIGIGRIRDRDVFFEGLPAAP
ncbi:MAG: VOC family protein [Gaiellaceae bacterium]|jgi:uncharacterized glyoxalase superfamily protein PhnB